MSPKQSRRLRQAIGPVPRRFYRALKAAWDSAPHNVRPHLMRSLQQEIEE